MADTSAGREERLSRQPSERDSLLPAARLRRPSRSRPHLSPAKVLVQT
jgi:hypothetical protein